MFIKTNNLIKTYNGRNVVNGVSVRVDRGQVVGLLGPNGAGKTTTFYMIVGIEKPTSGTIYIDNADVTHLPIHKRGAHGIGYLPQEASIFRTLTVEENLLAMLQTAGISKEEQQQKAESLMDEFSVSALRDRPGIQLSGGERRRVEIARCLCMDPSFILLDEPFAGIDPLAVNDIMGVITHLKNAAWASSLRITMCAKHYASSTKPICWPKGRSSSKVIPNLSPVMSWRRETT